MRKHRHAAQRLQEHTTNTANANAKSAEHSEKENAVINQKTKHPFEVLFLYSKRGEKMSLYEYVSMMYEKLYHRDYKSYVNAVMRKKRYGKSKRYKRR